MAVVKMGARVWLRGWWQGQGGAGCGGNVARMGRRAWWECRWAGSSPPRAYTCLSAQGLLRKKAAGAVATDHHNSPTSFPDDFDDEKLGREGRKL